jgi:hypothetical protein
MGAPEGFCLACRAQRTRDSTARVTDKPVPPIPYESTKIRELRSTTPAAKLGQGLLAVLYPLLAQKNRRDRRVVIGELRLGEGMVNAHWVIPKRTMTQQPVGSVFHLNALALRSNRGQVEEKGCR